MFYILLNICQEPKHFASWMQTSNNLFNQNKMIWGRSWAPALADPSLHPWLTNTWCTDSDKWHSFSLPPFSHVHNEGKDIPLLWRRMIRLADIWAAVWLLHGPTHHWNSHPRVCLTENSKMLTWYKNIMKNMWFESLSPIVILPHKNVSSSQVSTQCNAPSDCQSRPFLGMFCNHSVWGQPFSQDKEASFAAGRLSWRMELAQLLP